MAIPRFEAYQDQHPRIPRCWSVWENDGSEDGRLVAGSMTLSDAELVARLLNDQATEPGLRSGN